jgi:hypothetical protein
MLWKVKTTVVVRREFVDLCRVEGANVSEVSRLAVPDTLDSGLNRSGQAVAHPVDIEGSRNATPP